jgi:hypothetical protein
MAKRRPQPKGKRSPQKEIMTQLTHAQTINGRYLKSTSHFVSLQQRLSDALKSAPVFVNMLTAMVAEFKRRHPNWSKFEDLALCKAIMVPMDKILIDTTMQRSLNLRHILNILQHFRSTMTMAIQVYEDEDKPGYYIAWDGQHTAITLFIILTKVFGEQVANAIVPVVVYNVKHKLEIRRNFILLNGDAKEELDFIDKYIQMVYGVKVDKADDPEWVDTALKNDYLADAGLFATHSKFGDEDQPGAFTLLADTLMSKSLKTRKHPEVTRMFATYWSFLNQQRPVEPKEARQLYEYFNLCYEQGITVDDEYLLEFVQFTKDNFEADFGPNGPFWDKVRMAYESWYAKANPESYADSGLRGFTTEMRTGIPFLIAQVKKSTKLATPTYSANNGFTVAKKDLW